MVHRWISGGSVSLPVHGRRDATLVFKPVPTAGNHRSKALCILKYIYYSSSSLIKYPSFKTLLHVCVCTHASKRKQKIFHLQQLLYTSTEVCSWLPQTSLFHGFSLDCSWNLNINVGKSRRIKMGLTQTKQRVLEFDLQPVCVSVDPASTRISRSAGLDLQEIRKVQMNDKTSVQQLGRASWDRACRLEHLSNCCWKQQNIWRPEHLHLCPALGDTDPAAASDAWGPSQTSNCVKSDEEEKDEGLHHNHPTAGPAWPSEAAAGEGKAPTFTCTTAGTSRS